MLKGKNGVSIISLVLCAIAVTFVTTALVLATNNSARYRASEIVQKSKIIESSAYIKQPEKIEKIYTKGEIEVLARQAYVNNYLELYEGKINLDSFQALVIGELMQSVPINQLERFDITITENGISVK